jgi:amidohydrolase
MGCQAEVTVRRITPALVNDERLAAKVQETARQVLPDSELDTGYRTMTAEDMAFMQEMVPGCYFFVGSSDPSRHLDYGHHHPRFDFNEQALVRASALMASAALDILQSAA